MSTTTTIPKLHTSATISVIVPLFFPDPTDLDRIRSQLSPFFAQFPAEPQGLEIFLSDSGPNPTAAAPIASLIAELLNDRPKLREVVKYHREVTDGLPLSRAEAMNLGVQRTQHQTLLFLHVDCRLPTGALDRIRTAVSNGALGGGFTKVYEGKRRFSPLHLTEHYLNRVRTVKERRMVGTNAIFLSRELALEHPYQGDFLEDVELSDWLRKRLRPTALKIIEDPVTVSARKYHKYGPYASIAINASVMILYRVLRVRPSKLRAQLYHRRFPKNWKFWPAWLQTVLTLVDQGGQRDES